MSKCICPNCKKEYSDYWNYQLGEYWNDKGDHYNVEYDIWCSCGHRFRYIEYFVQSGVEVIDLGTPQLEIVKNPTLKTVEE